MLEQSIIEDLNTISDWLAVDDFSQRSQAEPDLMILAGNAILPTILGALEHAARSNLPVLLSGGIGHSTELLQQAVSSHRMTSAVCGDVDTLSEAEIMGMIASRVFSIPDQHIYIESESTNCGLNAEYSYDMIVRRKLDVRSAILVQDPLMQRRTCESFRFTWLRYHQSCDFINWPVFRPRLSLCGDTPLIVGGNLAGIWSINRYIPMLLGEVKRLRNDAEGYGPAGAGFIGPVSIPQDVEASWQRLSQDRRVMSVIR